LPGNDLNLEAATYLLHVYDPLRFDKAICRRHTTLKCSGNSSLPFTIGGRPARHLFALERAGLRQRTQHGGPRDRANSRHGAQNIIRGAVRAKVVKTTVPDASAPCPHDKKNRVFRAPAPNLLWVSDFTYVSTWQGFVYMAFVIDTFDDRIVSWRVSRSGKTDFVLPFRDHAAHEPAGQRMRWNRPCMADGLFRMAD